VKLNSKFFDGLASGLLLSIIFFNVPALHSAITAPMTSVESLDVTTGQQPDDPVKGEWITSQKANELISGYSTTTTIGGFISKKNLRDVAGIMGDGYVYKGERGYLPKSFHEPSDCDIIMTIVTRLETHRIKEAISILDPNAFFYTQRIKEVKGGIVKKVTAH